MPLRCLCHHPWMATPAAHPRMQHRGCSAVSRRVSAAAVAPPATAAPVGAAAAAAAVREPTKPVNPLPAPPRVESGAVAADPPLETEARVSVPASSRQESSVKTHEVLLEASAPEVLEDSRTLGVAPPTTTARARDLAGVALFVGDSLKSWRSLLPGVTVTVTQLQILAIAVVLLAVVRARWRRCSGGQAERGGQEMKESVPRAILLLEKEAAATAGGAAAGGNAFEIDRVTSSVSMEKPPVDGRI